MLLLEAFQGGCKVSDDQVDREIGGRGGSFLPDPHRGPSDEVHLAQGTAHQDMQPGMLQGPPLKPQGPGSPGHVGRGGSLINSDVCP